MELRSGTVVAPPTPAEQDAWFREGVRLCLGTWTALQLAVENEWGGPRSREKLKQLEGDVVNWFYRGKPPFYSDDLEPILDEALVQDFNTEAEDGSILEVADLLVGVYTGCAEGNYDEVRRLQAKGTQGRDALARSSQLDIAEPLEPAEGMDVGASHQNEVGPSSSAVSSDGMDVEGDTSSRPEAEPLPKLSEEEIAEGWEMAPARPKRRGGKGRT